MYYIHRRKEQHHERGLPTYHKTSTCLHHIKITNHNSTTHSKNLKAFVSFHTYYIYQPPFQLKPRIKASRFHIWNMQKCKRMRFVWIEHTTFR
jgi:hypothetical protein